MSPLIAVVLIGGALLLVAMSLVAGSKARGQVDARREWTWVRATVAASLVVGVVVAWTVNALLDLGRGTMLIPAVFGFFVVEGVGLGEIVVRPQRPTGPRTASLAPRRIVYYLPRSLATAVAAVTAVQAATLALTTATASADDTGHAGRWIAAQCGDAASAAGPYPGSSYSVPLALLLVVIGLTAWAALTAVVRRPRGFAPDDVGDDVLRSRSAARVLAAAGAASAASQAGIAVYAGTALLRMNCQDAWMVPVGWVLVVSIPAAVLLFGWFLRQLVAPSAVRTVAYAASPR